MSSVIAVHPEFDGYWPFAADYFRQLWQAQGPLTFIRLAHGDQRPLGDVIAFPAEVTRLVSLNLPVTERCLGTFPSLREAAFAPDLPPEMMESLTDRGVRVHTHTSEGYWGQSVAEFALALTLCGLRRIPQTHHEIIHSPLPWDYNPPDYRGAPGVRGAQFGDDARFTNGTIEGKRVRVAGVGNIGSRYAGFVHMLGADVAAWDPYASDPCFHRSGARKEWRLDRLVQDAEIFAPMLPLTGSTRGIVTADHINALPRGCLVVLATRAAICDMPALRARVLSDQLSLAADVFDLEPLPLDDPLLGRHNVVHTPHNAGRTIDANKRWVEHLAAQFAPLP